MYKSIDTSFIKGSVVSALWWNIQTFKKKSYKSVCSYTKSTPYYITLHIDEKSFGIQRHLTEIGQTTQ